MEYAPPVRRITYRGGKTLARLRPMARVPYELLDPAVRYLWMLGKIIFWLIVLPAGAFLALVTGLFGWLLRHPLPAMAGLCVLGPLILLHVFWSFLSYPRWGYALRETDLLIRSGVLFQSVIAVPFNRIQHVDSAAGPLTRGMGMAQLIIHTAGAHMGSVSLPGLPAERAEALRDYLSQVGHTHANI